MSLRRPDEVKEEGKKVSGAAGRMCRMFSRKAMVGLGPLACVYFGHRIDVGNLEEV